VHAQNGSGGEWACLRGLADTAEAGVPEGAGADADGDKYAPVSFPPAAWVTFDELAAAVGRCMPRIRSDLDEIDAEVLRDLLLVAGEDIPLDRIAGWSREDRVKVADWASREHLSSADNPVERHPRPPVLAAANDAATIHGASDDLAPAAVPPAVMGGQAMTQRELNDRRAAMADEFIRADAEATRMHLLYNKALGDMEAVTEGLDELRLDLDALASSWEERVDESVATLGELIEQTARAACARQLRAALEGGQS
jgi:hypothetical protein